MLKMIEKLINEHGSSTILKERLQLFSDKYSALENKLEAAQQKNSALEAKNKSLESQLQQAQQEIKRSQEIINTGAEAQGIEKLNEIEESILETLFKTNTHFSVANLALEFSIEESPIKYHIEHLLSMKFLGYGPTSMNAPMYYVISEAGRKYVVEQIRT